MPPRPPGGRAAGAPPGRAGDRVPGRGEPTGNLEAESGALVLGLLRAAADAGRAVVVVTHEPEATARADRVVTLRDGRLEGGGDGTHRSWPSASPPRRSSPASA